jgi:hypothetical protein
VRTPWRQLKTNGFLNAVWGNLTSLQLLIDSDQGHSKIKIERLAMKSYKKMLNVAFSIKTKEGGIHRTLDSGYLKTLRGIVLLT